MYTLTHMQRNMHTDAQTQACGCPSELLGWDRCPQSAAFIGCPTLPSLNTSRLIRYSPLIQMPRLCPWPLLHSHCIDLFKLRLYAQCTYGVKRLDDIFQKPRTCELKDFNSYRMHKCEMPWVIHETSHQKFTCLAIVKVQVYTDT